MTGPDHDAYLDSLAEAHYDDRDADLAADLDHYAAVAFGDTIGNRAEGLR